MVKVTKLNKIDILLNKFQEILPLPKISVFIKISPDNYNKNINLSSFIIQLIIT